MAQANGSIAVQNRYDGVKHTAHHAQHTLMLKTPSVLLAVRNWPTFVARLVTPAAFVFLIWLINILVVAGLNIFNQVLLLSAYGVWCIGGCCY